MQKRMHCEDSVLLPPVKRRHMSTINNKGGHHYYSNSKQTRTLQDYIHNLAVPSAPAERIHGSRGWKRASRTPRPSWISCPLRTLSGTMRGLVTRSEYTVAWNTWTVPSSEVDKKSGNRVEKATDRIARGWYRSVLYGRSLRSRSCQTSRLS
jgi:hypothetical protein